MHLVENDGRIATSILGLNLTGISHLNAFRNYIERSADLMRQTGGKLTYGGEPVGTTDLIERCEPRRRGTFGF